MYRSLFSPQTLTYLYVLKAQTTLSVESNNLLFLCDCFQFLRCYIWLCTNIITVLYGHVFSFLASSLVCLFVNARFYDKCLHGLCPLIFCDVQFLFPSFIWLYFVITFFNYLLFLWFRSGVWLCYVFKEKKYQLNHVIHKGQSCIVLRSNGATVSP
jgi:hypothetical protein